MKQVLVISPHPDDESIGCGGTLRKHVLDGDRVEVVFLTSGELGGHGRPAAETARLREGEAQRAAKILGIADVEFYREPDGNLRPTSSLIKRLNDRLQEFGPEIVYLPHEQEMHCDHRAAVDLLRLALDGIEEPPDVLMFEVWTPTQQLDEIVDISPYVETKREAIRAYQSQCEAVDFEQAILGLNRYRGEMHCWPQGDFAEVFTRPKLQQILIPGGRP